MKQRVYTTMERIEGSVEFSMPQQRFDIDGNEVFVGDKLLCITAEFSFNRLQEGATYTAIAAYDGTPVVMAGNGGPHCVERFRKITA